MQSKQHYVYIISNHWDNVLYIGVTNNLERRIIEHKSKIRSSFSSRYNVYKLIYFEEYSYPLDAIKREKQIKRWRKDKKLFLIRLVNPLFKDLFL
jgi:putative endonuclease